MSKTRFLSGNAIKTLTTVALYTSVALPISGCKLQIAGDMGAARTPSGLALSEPDHTPTNHTTAKILVSGVRNSDTVSLYADSACKTPFASAMATDSTVVITTPVLAEGTYQFYAKAENALTRVSNCSTASLTHVVDTTPPSKPSGITRQAPASALANNATPVLRISGVASGDIVSVYSDSTCTSLKGTATASATTVDVTTNTLPAGAYTFYARSSDVAGNVSACSSANVAYTLDLTPPSVPSGLALITPIAAISDNPTPVIRVSGVASGDSISLYSDSTCSTLRGSGTASAATIDITTTALPMGNYDFYAKATDPAGNASACSSATVNYLYRNTVIAFNRNYYSISSTGAVGAAITVVGDYSTSAHSVTVTSTGLTGDNSDITLNAQTVTLGSGVTSVPVTLPAPASNAAVEGDKFIKLSLSSPTNSATLGPMSDAQVNLIDNQMTENFYFAKPLYFAVENVPTASVVVQRAGSTAAAATVQIGFIDGTAVAPTDYDNTPITVSFGIGVSEVTATIPIVRRAGVQPNRSFYLVLQNPSVGTKLRPWATAKVRLLDVDDTTVCDTSITNGFGGGAGTPASPYLICSLAQLNLVRSNLTSNFKLMTDLNVDPNLDADPITAGSQAFLPITGTLTGSFDGNERILLNFKYTQTVASTDPVGFFSNLSGSTATIQKLNLDLAYNENTFSGGYNAGIVGTTSASIGTVSDNYYNGLIRSTGASRSGGIIAFPGGTHASAYSRNFTTGHVVSTGTGDLGGIMAGIYASNISGQLDKNFSTATIAGTGAIGGLVGRVGGPVITGLTADIKNSHARGVILGGTTNHAGGLAGFRYASTGSDIGILNSFATGPVNDGISLGGLVGEQACYPGASNCNVTNSYATGNVTRNSTNSNYGQGGLIGVARYESTFTIDNVYATGTVSATSIAEATGGLVGSVVANAATSATLTISNCHATGNVSTTNASSTRTGGLIGLLDEEGATAPIVVINTCYATGTVSSGGNFVGGIAGSLWPQSTSLSTIRVQNTYATGNVTGANRTGGFFGSFNNTSNSWVLDVSNSYATGNVTGVGAAPYIGGFVGYIVSGGPVTTTISFDQTYATGTVTSPSGSYIGGFMGYLSSNGTGGTNITFNRTYATGAVSNASGNYAGSWAGLAGVYGTGETLNISSSYATGNCTTTSRGSSFIGLLQAVATGAGVVANITNSYSTGATTVANTKAGGLAAGLDVGNGGTVNIQNFYSTGAITGGTGNAAGLVGMMAVQSGTGFLNVTNSYSRSILSGAVKAGLVAINSGTPTITNSYWLKDTGMNAAMADDGNQKTVTQLQTQGTFNLWDFTTIWNPPSTGVYPTLR